MGKELVPRFKCPLCGWLAYYSMLDKGPYKPEIKGMEYEGFQKISYHSVWDFGAKKRYKEFLHEKVRELAKKLGIELVDEGYEEKEDKEYKEDAELKEVETEPEEEVDEVDEREKGFVQGTPSRAISAHPSTAVAITPTVPLTPFRPFRAISHGSSNKTQSSASIERGTFAEPPKSMSSDKVIETDSTSVKVTDSVFVKGGEEDG